ncbi:MAG TPA: DUF309 domain-containing protein, partial [Anaerolineales bacterium]
EKGPLRDLYRGILQIAVTYLHITRNNYDGAVKVYGRSQKWMRAWQETCLGIDIDSLKTDAENVMAEVQRLGRTGLGNFDKALLRPIVVHNG